MRKIHINENSNKDKIILQNNRIKKCVFLYLWHMHTKYKNTFLYLFFVYENKKQ